MEMTRRQFALSFAAASLLWLPLFEPLSPGVPRASFLAVSLGSAVQQL